MWAYAFEYKYMGMLLLLLGLHAAFYLSHAIRAIIGNE